MQKEQLKQKLKSVKLLYVEDDPYQMEQTKAILGLFFDNIRPAKDGDEAMEYLKKEKFDLLFCDIMLPTISGIELAKKIRQYDENLFIIFISSSTESEYFRGAIRLEAFDYILKPYSFESLSDTLYRFAQKYFKEDANYFDICEGVVYNAKKHCAVINNKEITLTKKEQALFNLVIKNNFEVVTYDMIWNSLYDEDSGVNITAIKNIIFRLRKKLGADIFINISEVGYRII